VIAGTQPDIDTGAWADRFDSKDTGIVRRRHTNRADDQTLEYCRFGQSSLYRKRLQAQLELRIDSTLDAGTCGHAEYRLTSAALCLSCKTHELTSEGYINRIAVTGLASVSERPTLPVAAQK
jgi:hypothetical protein